MVNVLKGAILRPDDRGSRVTFSALKKSFFAWPGAGYSSVREEEVNSKLVFTWKYNFETLIGVREKTCLEFFLTVYKLVWDFRIIPSPPSGWLPKDRRYSWREGRGGRKGLEESKVRDTLAWETGFWPPLRSKVIRAVWWRNAGRRETKP